MKFPCDRCGKCCANVNLSPLVSYLDRGDGSCRYLDTATKLCSIYEQRPEICRVELQFQKHYAEQYSWDDFVKLNLKACEALKNVCS